MNYMDSLNSILTKNQLYWDQMYDYNNYNQYEYYDKKNINNYFSPNVSKYLYQNGFHLKFPYNKEFCICLTHDVDDINIPLSHKLLYSLSLLKKMIKTPGIVKNKDNYSYNTIKKIISLEKKYDAKSTFFFLCTNEDIVRYRYEIETLSDELAFIKDQKFEIGLHGGYYSYDNEYKITLEKTRIEKIINQNIVGFRNHYLNLKIPETWEYLSKLKFKYDSTFGYSNIIGYRNGTCYPFKPYNWSTHKIMDLIEIPMNVMDTVYREQSFLKRDFWNIISYMIKEAKKYHGVITINFHNHVFFEPFYEDYIKIYNNILKMGQDQNAWMTNCIELSNCLKDEI